MTSPLSAQEALREIVALDESGQFEDPASALIRDIIARTKQAEKVDALNLVAGIKAELDDVTAERDAAYAVLREVLAWLTENAPELVRVKREPDLRALHARMVDGERFPGVSLSEGTEAFHVDVVTGEQP